MDGALERVRTTTKLETARETLLAAVSYSRRHFDKEERIIFPMAERILKLSTLAELGQIWMDERARVAVT
jgi:hemerythrin-like domain-containing protein